MAKMKISNEELWTRVEEARLLKERIEEPYLLAFRATPEEIQMGKAEDAQKAALPDDRLLRWGERIARCGREGVRFQRYLIRQGFYPKVPKDDPLGMNS